MLNDTDQYQNTYTLNSALCIVIKGLFRKLPNFLHLYAAIFLRSYEKLNTFSFILH